MKIGFYLSPYIIFSGDSNGIKSQANIWRKGLENKGVIVVQLNVWGNEDLAILDAIHIFGRGVWIYPFVNRLKKINSNIFISPIIDSNTSLKLYKLASYTGIKKMRMYSENYSLRMAFKLAKGVCVRSKHEFDYVKVLSVPEDKISVVPLSYGLEINTITNEKKEDFCLHVSSIYQGRKNVIRLIKAAKKYKFKLILAGNKGNDSEFNAIRKEIGESKNIEVLGFVSREKLIELNNKAKVFALPSIYEGVGIVALDAALYGANIVITNIGGPKEYYEDMAYQVSPYSVDEIGKSVLKGLKESKFQPKLKNHISKKYSLDTTIDSLRLMYQKK